jgi:hypothetical protein
MAVLLLPATTAPTATVTHMPTTHMPTTTRTLHRLSLSERRQRLHSRAWRPTLPTPLARLALWLSLAPHCGPFTGRTAFWDTHEITHANDDLRPTLRRRAARDCAEVRRTLHTIQRMPHSGGAGVVSDAQWCDQINALAATVAAQAGQRVTVAWDTWGAAHYELRAGVPAQPTTLNMQSREEPPTC